MLKKILLGLCVLFSINANAQKVISGKVTDKKGEAIVGANVYMKNTSLTSIDVSGNLINFIEVNNSEFTSASLDQLLIDLGLELLHGGPFRLVSGQFVGMNHLFILVDVFNEVIV